MADIPIPVGSASLSIGTASPSTEKNSVYPLSGSLTLPKISASGIIQPPLQLPAITASGTLLSGNITKPSQQALALPKLAASGTVLGGGLYSGAVTLPAITAAGNDGINGNVRLPKLRAVGTVLPGNIATLRTTLPRITASGNVHSDGLIEGTVTLPRFNLSGNALNGGVLNGAATLPRIALAASGYSGAVVTGAVVLPIIGASGTLYGENVLRGVVELPMLLLTATMSGPAPANSEAFVMNMRSAGLTTYNNFAFNSMTRFNGVDLVANDSGIYAIGGNLDDTAVIDAYARSGITDFGDIRLKRVEMAYLAYRADGEMRLKIITDEHHENEYQLYPRNYSEIHGNRQKLGRGVKGTYWQVEFGNVDGSDFELDSLQLIAQPLARKIA